MQNNKEVTYKGKNKTIEINNKNNSNTLRNPHGLWIQPMGGGSGVTWVFIFLVYALRIFDTAMCLVP